MLSGPDGEVVARGAVEPEQLATARRVVAAQLLTLLAGQDRAAAARLDERHQLLDLRGSEDSRLLLHLGALLDRGHPAGLGLEVDGRRADSDQAGAATGHAFQVGPVTRDAGLAVDVLTLTDRDRIRLRSGGLWLRHHHAVQRAGAQQGESQRQQAGDPAVQFRPAP
jgi:hypothetical protein